MKSKELNPVRQYDKKLLTLLKERVTIRTTEHLTYMEKKIPDSEGAGELDPRVLQLMMEGAAKSGGGAAGFPDLSEVRPETFPIGAIRTGMGFPNKDLTETKVSVELLKIEGEGGEIPIRIYRPAVTGLLPAVVFFHGGGFIGGSPDVVENPCRSLAEKAGALVVNVDYRLAPEHPFPAGVLDCYDAVQWVYRHADELGVDPSRIAVAGDSAGGNLAAGCAQMDRDSGSGMIRMQALIYPVLLIGESAAYPWRLEEYEIHRHQEYILPGLEALRGAGQLFQALYLQGHDPANPLVSPLLQESVEKLPETLIVTAEYDMLRLEGEAYAGRLAEAGVRTRLIRYKGMDHAFLDKYGIYPQAEDCIDEIASMMGRLSSSL